MTIWQEFYSEQGIFHIQRRILPGNASPSQGPRLLSRHTIRPGLQNQINTMFPVEKNRYKLILKYQLILQHSKKNEVVSRNHFIHSNCFPKLLSVLNIFT